MPRWANQPPSPYIYYGTLFRGASDSGRFFAVAGGRGAAPSGEGATPENAPDHHLQLPRLPPGAICNFLAGDI